MEANKMVRGGTTAVEEAHGAEARERRAGGEKGREEGGKDKLKEQGERFSIPPLTALRLSLAVLIHGFSGL